tara:strand:+ start:1 stop:996 length:996 start_codon:yes stop_codon:yes gene_type:complete
MLQPWWWQKTAFHVSKKNLKDEKIYKVDNLVIGSGLNAIVFAYLNNYTIINNKLKYPFRFEFFPPSLDFSFLYISIKNKEVQSRQEKKELGVSKVDVYKHLLFNLSLAGLAPLSDKVISIKLADDRAEAITERGTFAFEYKKVFVFDDENVHNLPEAMEVVNEDVYRVFDWINIRSCTSHPYDYFVTKEDFVNEVFFYPSERMDGHHKTRRDIVSVSYLSQEQIQQYDYSDTYAVFKIMKMMKSLGIRGNRNGRDMLDKTKYKYYALKLESDRREVEPLQINLYQDTKNVEFMYSSAEELINQHVLDQKSYLHKLTYKMDWKQYENRSGRV